MSIFNFFEPIIAPIPERAAIRPLSLAIPEIRDNFSPAIPIPAVFMNFPCFFFSFASASIISKPHISDASKISISSPVIETYLGLLAAPLNRMASYPHFFISGPNVPPLLASPHVLVNGDFPATIYLPESGAAVPVNKPGKKPKID